MPPPLVGQSNNANTAGVLGEGPTGVYGRNKPVPAGTPGNGVIGYSDQGRGVWGHSNDTGIGVLGESVKGRGVQGTSQQDYGVRGHSDNIAGIRGSSNASRGVEGWAKGSEGVVGITETGNGVWGQTQGTGIGVLGTSKGGTGVFGISETQTGVFGQTNGFSAGVIGFHGDPRLQETQVPSGQAGVFGASDLGSGVVAYTRNRNVPALYAFGGLRSYASLSNFAAVFDGNVQVNGDIFLPGADCAEHFDIQGDAPVEAGTVMVIDDDGTLRCSQDAYDRRVAGVISGAGEYKPGLILDKRESPGKRQPVALVGKVFCKVDAQYAPVCVGDLLTSSPTLGHAMKATDQVRAFGAVLGKALGSLAAGIGYLPVLVCLQ